MAHPQKSKQTKDRIEDELIQELKKGFLRVLHIDIPDTPFSEIFYELGILQGKYEAYKEAFERVTANNKNN